MFKLSMLFIPLLSFIVTFEDALSQTANNTNLENKEIGAEASTVLGDTEELANRLVHPGEEPPVNDLSEAERAREAKKLAQKADQLRAATVDSYDADIKADIRHLEKLSEEKK